MNAGYYVNPHAAAAYHAASPEGSWPLPGSGSGLAASFQSTGTPGAAAAAEQSVDDPWPNSLGQEWRDITFGVGEHRILNGVTGMALPGKITAVMGPSGSGKTTLLNVLSGRQRTSGYSRSGNNKSEVSFSGEVFCRGRPVETTFFRGKTAYVFQDNRLLDSDTARESLEFSAFLRLPSSVDKARRQELVDKLIDDLNLDNCQDVVVGGPLRKGLSGGEQKRVAVGVELIAQPRMIFLDEPLSGLDSYNAFTLTQTLKELAGKGVPVVMTVHQPSSEIYDLLDEILFLHRGQAVYQGRREDVVGHFASLGHRCPPNHNPADYALFIIQQDEQIVDNLKKQWPSSSSYSKLDNRIRNAAHGANPALLKMRTCDMMNLDLSDSDDEDSDDDGEQEFGVPKRSRRCWERQSALLMRDMRRTWRDRKQIISMYVQVLIVSLVYGWLFIGAGREEGRAIGLQVQEVADHPCQNGPGFVADQCVRAFQVHWGALGIVSINTMLMSITWAITVFQAERTSFMREAAGGYYSAFAYFVSKTLFELPVMGGSYIVIVAAVYGLMGLKANPAFLVFEVLLLSTASSSIVFCLSAWAATPEQAYALSPIAQIPQFAFAGILLPNEMIPYSLRWIKWICPLYYGMNMMALSEWKDTYREFDECSAKANGTMAVMMQSCPGTVTEVQALKSQGVEENHFLWPSLVMCLVMILCFRLLGVAILWRKSRFVL
eukprot:TRINITY_DN32408_c0_g1_i1.p1 TRINITY_DN32408_c0_g1~~TRINITY_DN32408_c0_g1_i1.p1  ORF type:complete len:717 (+),score=113.06 TRINITY_DN32408_c0_g1_i1:63-2213(+)